MEILTEVFLSERDVFCVLQAAQSVLISLFQLNTPEFSMLLAALPKTFQDGATKLLQNHLKNTGNVAQVKHTHKQTNSVSPHESRERFRHAWYHQFINSIIIL